MKRRLMVLVCTLCFNSYGDCSVKTQDEKKTSISGEKWASDGFFSLRDDVRKLNEDMAAILSSTKGKTDSQTHDAISEAYAAAIGCVRLLRNYRRESVDRIVDEMLKILSELLDSIYEFQSSGGKHCEGSCGPEEPGSYCKCSEEEGDESSESDDLIETLESKVKKFQASLEKLQNPDSLSNDYCLVSTGFYSECATIISALNLKSAENVQRLVKLSNLKDSLDYWLEW